jgi:polysaccharide biosynthesis transport protein
MKSENLPAVPQANNHLAGMSPDGFSMLQSEQEPSGSGPKLNDILFILFRHKWKILLCAVLGIVAAGCIYFFLPPIYESKAKLIVRYVVDRSATDNLDASVKTPGMQDENLINSEAEILTSQDVAMQVADVIGPELLVGPSKNKAMAPEAAREILRSLEVTALKGSNIISISYKNSDPVLAKQVLEQLVKFYFDKHLEVHRSVGAFDLVTRQTDQLRGELSQTEKELRELKAKAGITSLTEDTAALSAEMTKTQQDLNTAEAEIVSQEARLHEIEKWNSGEEAKQSANETKQLANATRQPNASVTDEYRSMVNRVAQLRQAETELLSKYTSQNRIVKVKQAQIEQLEKQRRDLEKKYPGLLATLPSASSSEGARPDFVSERARLVAAQAQAETLRSRLNALQERSKVYSEFAPRIGQLERTKEVQEANYKYLESSLQKARIDETLDPSRMPNIGVVEKPTTAEKTIRDVKKIVMGLSVGGLGVGIAIALLIELVLDRTVKRSQELETGLRIPLLLSIPNFAARGQSRLRLHDAGEDLDGAFSGDARPYLDPSEETGALLRPFCEAIRDRLGLFFELNQMTHKPKLVAVTGLSKNAGASTLATGLAASLSETGDGKVLLVDKPITAKKLYDLLLEFKQSDLSYVVFDMPSLGNTSATVPLAGFMDKVLLVVEAEKSNRDSVKRAYTQLSAKTDVSVIFNKSRSYGPKWLEGEV